MQVAPIVPVVESHEGKLVTSSLNISEVFKKRHSDVLRAIDDILSQAPEIFVKSNFALSGYRRKTGFGGLKSHKMYLLTRDAMVLLVMGFTGKEALEWKIRYIEAFNAMEEQLKAQSHPVPATPKLANVEERRPLNNIVRLWAQKSSQNYSQCWRQVNSAFNFTSVTQFPAAWIKDAVAWVQAKIDSLPLALPEPEPEPAPEPGFDISQANYAKTLSGKPVNLWDELEDVERQLKRASNVVGFVCRSSSTTGLSKEKETLLNVLDDTAQQALGGIILAKYAIKTALSIKGSVDFFKA